MIPRYRPMQGPCPGRQVHSPTLRGVLRYCGRPPRRRSGTVPKVWGGETALTPVKVVYALILDDTESSVLMVENHREGGMREWLLPGGAVEPGESLAEALVPEVEEEAGVRIIPQEVLAVNEPRFRTLGKHTVFFTFRATLVGGTVHVPRPAEIASAAWVPLSVADSRLPYHPEGISGLLQVRCPYHDDGVI